MLEVRFAWPLLFLGMYGERAKVFGEFADSLWLSEALGRVVSTVAKF
jgi:hypothetical protein